MTTSIHPPGPKRKPWGHLLAFHRDPIGFLMRIARDYGDLASFQMGPIQTHLLNHPDYIKDVLVTHHRNFIKIPVVTPRRERKTRPRTTWLKLLLGEGLLSSEGDLHRQHRRILQPGFHPQRLAAYGALMRHYAIGAMERWRDGDTVDVAREMRRLTLPIAGRALFGTDMESEAEEITEAFATIIELQCRITMPVAILFKRFPLPTSRRFQNAMDRLHVTISRCIHERQASGTGGDDLLSILLHAQDSEGNGCGMTDAQVLDHIRTFLLTGFFTTANALTWTWYLLSQHPDVEARLHAELDSVLAGKAPTVDDLKNLRYTEMVLAEALRVYPPIWIMSRWSLSEFKFGDCNLPAKSFILISPYVTHHSPRHFPDPFRFDPQRWTPEARAERPAFAYHPFGGGPRQCIGEGFAWMEAMLILATLAQQWQMRLVPGHPVEMEAQASTTLRPKYGIRMTLRQRKPALTSQAVG